jgi:hypothetical protein
MGLCAAACTLWSRSHHVADDLRYRKVFDPREPIHIHILVFKSGAGAIQFGWGTGVHYAPKDTPPRDKWFYACEENPEHPSKRSITSGSKRSLAGFGVLSDRKLGPPMSDLPVLGVLFVPSDYQWIQTFSAIWMPLWFLAALFASIPARQIYLWFRYRRRKARGRCVTCGYDLRAGGDKCPECGATTCYDRRANSASISAN